MGRQLDEIEQLSVHLDGLAVGARVDLRQLALGLVVAHELVDAAHFRHHRIDRGVPFDPVPRPELDVHARAHDRFGALEPHPSSGQRRRGSCGDRLHRQARHRGKRREDEPEHARHHGIGSQGYYVRSPAPGGRRRYRRFGGLRYPSCPLEPDRLRRGIPMKPAELSRHGDPA